MLKDEVTLWLSNGADLHVGARLYLHNAHNDAFKLLVSNNPESVKKQLFDALIRLGGIDDHHLIESQRNFFAPMRRSKFRDRWPFLSDKNCPDELKILAADKITVWHEYLSAYSDFSGCVSCVDYYRVARRAMTAFIENSEITKEFDFFSYHGHCLGRHPIFNHRRKVADLKSLGPVKLAKRQEQLLHTIWRIKKVMSDGKRPDLQIARERSLVEKEFELKEVVKLLSLYV